MTPNLIERIENLLAALDQADAEIENEARRAALECVDNARGITSEILTMIDGRKP